jgi:hypothetical protein
MSGTDCCAACSARRHLVGVLCNGCEGNYEIYVSLYRPKKVRSTDGRRYMSKPQTRHQWAAHQKKASQ